MDKKTKKKAGTEKKKNSNTEKHFGRNLIVSVIAVFTLSFSIVTYLLFKDVNTIASGIGGSAGGLAGKAAGSVQGYTEGYEEGKREGLKVKDEDVYAVITSSMKEQGVLEVLEADVSAVVDHDIGKQCSILFSMNGKATYKVDLGSAKISVTEENVTVVLPELFVSYNPDPDSVEEIASYNPTNRKISYKEGAEAVMEARDKLKNKLKQSIESTEEYMGMARKAALKPVEELAEAVTGKRAVVSIEKEVVRYE